MDSSNDPGNVVKSVVEKVVRVIFRGSGCISGLVSEGMHRAPPQRGCWVAQNRFTNCFNPVKRFSVRLKTYYTFFNNMQAEYIVIWYYLYSYPIEACTL